MLAIVIEITPIIVAMTEINALHLTAEWSSRLTTTVIAPALVNTSQVVTTIVVVEVDTTLKETTPGTVVMLITSAKGVHALALAHALVAATSLQVALIVDHAAPAIDVPEAQATTVVAVQTTPTTPTTCTK